MQEGKLYIDGKDVFVRYGVFVEQYGYKELVKMPAFKSMDSTEWDEYDGAEFDLSAPMFDTKTAAIQFCVIDITLASDLFELLSDKSYHVFDFKELGRKYKLRLVNNGSLSSNIKLGKLALSFADDFAPVTKAYADELKEKGETLDEYHFILGQTPYAKAPAGFRQDGYEIDDIDFSRLGIYVVGKTDNNIQKAPNVRENLSSSNKAMPGVSYDDDAVRYKTKDVQLSLFIHAGSITEFWTRWHALFTILAQPEARTLYLDKISEGYNCFYKKCDVSKFDILRSGRIWCEFSVTLTFTDFRPNGLEELLASEFGELITTEDDVECFIDLNRYAD